MSIDTIKRRKQLNTYKAHINNSKKKKKGVDLLK